MKWYWTKIVLGALAIFLVGYAGISVVRATKHEVRRVAESDADISIPIPFVPFSFEGEKSGSFRKLVLHRSDPHRLTGVDVVVRVSDPALLERLRDCNLTVDNPTQINHNTTFRCAGADSSLAEFGQVIVEVRSPDGSRESVPFPLMIPKTVIRDLEHKPIGRDHARAEADRFRELGDSMRVLGRQLSRARTDSARDHIRDLMDEVRFELEELQETVVEEAEARARAAAEARPEAPVPPRAPTPPAPPAGDPPAR